MLACPQSTALPQALHRHFTVSYVRFKDDGGYILIPRHYSNRLNIHRCAVEPCGFEVFRHDNGPFSTPENFDLFCVLLKR
jgi:hypothetical protein